MQRQSTVVKYKTDKPTWDQAFDFSISPDPVAADEVLRVKVYDKQALAKSALASITLPIEKILQEIHASVEGKEPDDKDAPLGDIEYVPDPYRVGPKSQNKDIRVWLKFKLMKGTLPDFKQGNVFLLNLTLGLGPGLKVKVSRGPLTVAAEVQKVVFPFQVVLEWKPPNVDKVPQVCMHACMCIRMCVCVCFLFRLCLCRQGPSSVYACLYACM
jgi:hypothetical protein